jgi:UDP-galactopyranose mutase
MDIICYSHLRWNFVYQRPQHIISRMARQFRAFFFEEPVFRTGDFAPYYDVTLSDENVFIIVPHLPAGLSETEMYARQSRLLGDLFERFQINKFIAWYYTPMALGLVSPVVPGLVVYDCMDELSAFKNAPPALAIKEMELLQIADIVFTGGKSLYDAKKHLHRNIHLFPSSIDINHFREARVVFPNEEPPDQMPIGYPRIGFFGVIDERMDILLLDALAKEKPDWHFIMIGPVVKIDPDTLPMHPNIHYLGIKSYQQLPLYLSRWQVAIMPFAINESTRYISPTKTPEYLAAGKPVISTPIHDVIVPYGEEGFVYIAGDTKEFINGIQLALEIKNVNQWLKAVDTFLAKDSWDTTCEKMIYLINIKLEEKKNDPSSQIKKEGEYV